MKLEINKKQDIAFVISLLILVGMLSYSSYLNSELVTAELDYSKNITYNTTLTQHISDNHTTTMSGISVSIINKDIINKIEKYTLELSQLNNLIAVMMILTGGLAGVCLMNNNKKQNTVNNRCNLEDEIKKLETRIQKLENKTKITLIDTNYNPDKSKNI